MKTIAVVGTGLVGTSVALALRRRGVAVHLLDTNESAARTAASLGAGSIGAPGEPVDLAVLAVPPAHAGRVLAEQQRLRLAHSYTDVTSVKAAPQREAEAAGGDLADYIGGHPLAGRERSGPLAARADLFEGRPWVLTPSAQTSQATLNRALELISTCGAVPVVMGPEAHDHAVALVSHAPHLISALMAARLEHAPEEATRLAGQGLRDVVRIAAGDRELWREILTANAGAVADVLDDYSADLAAAIGALRELARTDGADCEPATQRAVSASIPVLVPAPRTTPGAASIGRGKTASVSAQNGSTATASHRSAKAVLSGLLARGNAGHLRIPGKPGISHANCSAIPVAIGDRPGELARLFAAASEGGVNIEDVSIKHAADSRSGLVELMVESAAADRLSTRLADAGWSVSR